MSAWSEVQALFEEASRLEPVDRERVLRERAAVDSELAREVADLLEADTRPWEAFALGGGGLFAELRGEEDPEGLCGARIGPYRVDDWLASGGAAHVYRAVREREGTERRVALKVMRRARDTAGALERFQRERALLASLEHENIVTFLDAGALPDGRLFLAMELVEGRTITEWGRGRPLDERLALFRRVLAAVQYAHEKLVVHRDLKPGNVLVTREGTPKLLDFGVSTLLDDPDEPATALTPAFASPEQLRGEPCTAASDVYSLGVLLVELVTGRPVTAEEDPRARALPGDLGAVARRALAADPRERYHSADRLADDLERLDASLPVSARAATPTYRLALFLRRNRWRVALAAALVLALAAGWIASDLERAAAERDASTGWQAHGQARAVARLYEDWIAAAEAGETGDVVAYLEAAVVTDLAELPEAETLVRLTLARLYLARGETPRAHAHAERARALAEVTPGVGRRARERAEALWRETSGAADAAR